MDALNDKIKFPWLNIWMIVFAAFGVWTISNGLIRLVGSVSYIHLSLAAVTTVGVLLVALLRVPKPATEEKPGLPGLEQTGEHYLEALRTITEHKWIFCIFAVVALVNIAGAYGEHAVQRYYYAEVGPPQGWMNPLTLYAPGIGRLVADGSSQAYPREVVWSLNMLVPRLGAADTAPAFALYLLIFAAGMIPVMRRARRLSSEPALAYETRFIRGILPPVAIASLGAAGLRLYVLLTLTTPWSLRQYALPQVFVWEQALFFTVLAGLILAGVVGSLLRIHEKRAVTRDSFAQDVLTFFRPTLGVFLMLTLARLTLNAPVVKGVFGNMTAGIVTSLWAFAAVAFMMAPFAVVRQRLGSWQALTASVNLWRGNAAAAFSFVALGFTFVGTTNVIAGTLSQYLNYSCDRWTARFVSGIVYHSFAAFVTPVMLVAMWEFYPFVSGEKK